MHMLIAGRQAVVTTQSCVSPDGLPMLHLEVIIDDKTVATFSIIGTKAPPVVGNHLPPLFVHHRLPDTWSTPTRHPHPYLQSGGGYAHLTEREEPTQEQDTQEQDTQEEHEEHVCDDDCRSYGCRSRTL